MVLRHAGGGIGPGGGPVMSDIIGRILAVDDTVVTIERRDGSVVSVGESAIGRIVVTGEGPASAVSSPHPRPAAGLATHIIGASRRWAAVRGAYKIHLQTIRECTAAPRSMRRTNSATITNGAT